MADTLECFSDFLGTDKADLVYSDGHPSLVDAIKKLNAIIENSIITHGFVAIQFDAVQRPHMSPGARGDMRNVCIVMLLANSRFKTN